MTASPRAIGARALILLGLLAGALALPTTSAEAATPSCSAAGIGVTSLAGPNFYVDAASTFRSGYTGYRVTNSTGSPLGDVWVALTGFSGGSVSLAPGQAPAQRLGDLAAAGSSTRYWYLTATGASAVAQNHVVTVYDHNPALPNAVALCTTTGGFGSVQSTIAANPNKISSVAVSGDAPRLGSQFTVTVLGNTGLIGSGIAGDVESFLLGPATAENWPASSFRLVSTNLSISPDGTAAPVNYPDTLRVANLGSTARDYTATYTFQAIGTTSSPTSVTPVQEIASGANIKHTGSFPTSIPPIPAPIDDLSLALSTSCTDLDRSGGTVTVTGVVSGTPGASLDGFTLSLPSGASVVPGSATWGGAPVADPVPSGGKLVLTGPFEVGTRHLQVDVAFDDTPGKRSVSAVGTLGSLQVGEDASKTDGSNPARATVDVDASPSAADGNVTTTADHAVAVDLSTLATDPDADPLTVASTGAATHGTLTVSGTTVTYTPEAGFADTDDFPYTVDDGRGGTATGTIHVRVDPAAVDPVPTDDPTSDSTSETSDATSDPTTDPVDQAITFAPDPVVLGIDQGVALSASADSGLPVDLTVTEGECDLDGTELTASAAGACTVRATQEGDAGHAAAAPVTAVVTFVVPSDDAATTTGATAVLVDVLANDPEGVTLDGATDPAHGTVSTAGDKLLYTPSESFRGTDTLTYTVVRDGRHATAGVSIDVANRAPVLGGRSVAQPAGTVRRVALDPTDPNGDPVSLSATSSDPDVRVTVEGRTVVLAASRAASGGVSVVVTARDDQGGTTSATVRTRITPLAPQHVSRSLAASGTTVRWSGAPTDGASYQVLLDGAVVCRTAATRCRFDAVAGPKRRVTVRTLGRSATQSSLVSGPLSGHGQVLVATVVFASGSSHLTAHDRRILDRAITKTHGYGFVAAALDGYTDADGGYAYNRHLSKHRTRHVARYLRAHGDLGSVQSWHGESDPVASNSGAAGKARNRRVEILVRY